MSDYRNPNSDYRNVDDPSRRGTAGDPNTGAASIAWGWIAAAIFAVIIVAAAFTLGHGPGQGGTDTASNEPPPVTTPMAPRPNGMAPPANPAAPLAPSPNTPAGRGAAEP
jgi:hypothetical protein